MLIFHSLGLVSNNWAILLILQLFAETIDRNSIIDVMVVHNIVNCRYNTPCILPRDEAGPCCLERKLS